MALPRHNQVVVVVRDVSAVEPLRRHLRSEGFAAITLGSVSAAMEAFSWHVPDVLLVDLHLWTEAREALRPLRKHPLGVLILVPAGSDPSSVAASQHGADAVIWLSGAPEESAASIRHVIRRYWPDLAPVLICDAVQLDLGSMRVTANGVPIQPGRLQLKLLEYFMRNPGVRCSRQRLLREVWGSVRQATPRTVDVYVQRLRQLLRAGGCEDYIRTVRGVGYQFMSPRQAAVAARDTIDH